MATGGVVDLGTVGGEELLRKPCSRVPAVQDVPQDWQLEGPALTSSLTDRTPPSLPNWSLPATLPSCCCLFQSSPFECSCSALFPSGAEAGKDATGANHRPGDSDARILSRMRDQLSAPAVRRDPHSVQHTNRQLITPTLHAVGGAMREPDWVPVLGAGAARTRRAQHQGGVRRGVEQVGKEPLLPRPMQHGESPAARLTGPCRCLCMQLLQKRGHSLRAGKVRWHCAGVGCSGAVMQPKGQRKGNIRIHGYLPRARGAYCLLGEPKCLRELTRGCRSLSRRSQESACWQWPGAHTDAQGGHTAPAE